FYGIEINDFAVSVAQTALWIAEIQMKRQTEEIFTDSQIEYLPLKSFAHFVEGNALRMDWNSVIAADKLNYIMGNPPFVGYSLQDKSQKEDLLATLTDENGKTLKTAGKVDYVAGWYYKACDYMQGTNIQAAFVSTNSICQGEQTAFIFKPLQQRYGIQFNFAYRTFRWDSESNDKAAVHCVIIGFSLNNNNNAAPTVIASEQSERGNPPTTENGSNLSGSLNNNSTAIGWACQPTNNAAGVDENLSGSLNNSTAVGWACQPTNRPDRGEENPMNTNNLSGNLNTTQSTPNGVAVGWEAHPTALPETATAPTTENKSNLSGSLKKQKIIYNGSQQIIAKNINAYLLDAPSVFVESRNKPICNIPDILKGSIPVDDGNFFFTTEEKMEFLKSEPKAEKYIKKFYGAREFLHNEERWCLWLINTSPSELKSMPKVIERIKKIQEFRLKSTKEATRKFADYSYRFMEIRQPESDYLLFPRVSSERRKYIPIGFVSPEIIASDACSIIPNATLYM
ncbi:MAG: hypothetical protein IKZ88_09430, partial [Neisseriaceae bacterium]|nr:hypothetical protein [Neisseriaceae bacterium]